MSVTLGFDLGTEYCRLAVSDQSGNTQQVMSEQRQEDATPCIVSGGRTRQWGWHAMGGVGPWAWDLRRCLLHGPRVVPGVEQSAQELLTDFLRNMRRRHSSATQFPAALSIPLTATLEQRDALRAVASSANLNLLDLINDCEAALWGYRYDEQARSDWSRVAVVIIGARSSQITIFEIRRHRDDLQTRILAHSARASGMRAWQNRVFAKALRPDLPPPVMRHASVMRSLYELHRQPSAPVAVDVLDLQISPAEANDHLQDWSNEVENEFSALLDLVGLAPHRLDAVLFAGGGYRLPQVQECLMHWGKRLDPPGGDVSYESVIAHGAARYAAHRQARGEEAWHSAQEPAFGFVLDDGTFHELVEVNCPTNAPRVTALDPAPVPGDDVFLLPVQTFAVHLRDAGSVVDQPLAVRLAAEANRLILRATKRDSRTIDVKLENGWQPPAATFMLR